MLTLAAILKPALNKLKMVRTERKKLLLEMLEANDRISDKSPYYIHEYSKCLLELCNAHDLKHATAICNHENEKQHADYLTECYYSYINNLEQADSQSDTMLKEMEDQQEIATSLDAAAEEGYDYFLRIYREEEKNTDLV